jgi:hypothetical protein
MKYKKADKSVIDIKRDISGNKTGKVTIEIHTIVKVYEENGIHYVENQDLDVIGYGNTLDEANNHFNATLYHLMEYWLEENTLEDSLIKCGFIKSESKDKTKVWIDFWDKIIQKFSRNEYQKRHEEYEFAF